MKDDGACRKTYQPADSDAAILLAVIGEKKMEKLQRLLGGRRVWIPKPGSRLRCLTCQARDQCIVLWRKDGRSARDIARFLGLSSKTVFHVAARENGRRTAKKRAG